MAEPLPKQDDMSLFDREWEVPWHAHLLPAIMAAVMCGLWLLSADPSMSSWTLSWASIQTAGALPLLWHMIAHGGLLHLCLNVFAILLLSGPIISRLGASPLSWLRYLYLFAGSGLSGAALFLVLAPRTGSAMLGSSGAVFGLVAALARVHPVTGHAVRVGSKRTWQLTWFFIQNHLALVALLIVVAFFTGAPVGLAWEAHLGGLLFGFLAAPLYLPRGTSNS